MEIRTTKPGAGNKYYIRKASGGYSNAIQGSPKDKECDVLANCVGYAYGRFNEIGKHGCCKYLAPVNAEDFMKYKGSCETGQTPKPGAVMVWEGIGNLAGHVAIVEKVYNNEEVYTSESGYGSSNPFWNSTRRKGNGNWGAGSNYRFLGFIYNPAVKEEPVVVKPTQKFQIGAKVIINGGLYRSSMADQAAGHVCNKVTNITRYAPGSKHPYNTTGDLGWMNESDIKLYTETTTYRKYYTVSKGDTLSGIAARNNTTYMKIYELNKSLIDNENRKRGVATSKMWIYSGQRLLLP